MLYFTGDTHGKILEKFSFANEPELRQLTNDDTMLILGDCGIPWFNPDLKFYTHELKPGYEKRELYTLKGMTGQKYHWLLLAGNHENYDLIKQMPCTYKYGAKLRIMSYMGFYSTRILIIDKPCVLTIEDKKILAIPGAESHDCNYVLEPVEETKDIIATIEKNNRIYYNSTSYRINHFSGGEEEAVDANAAYKIIEDEFNFDYVISHDVPAAVLERGKPYGLPARPQPTYSEQVLEGIRVNINYDLGLHGHYHSYINLPTIKTLGLYHQILSMDEINTIKKNNDINGKGLQYD